MNRKEYFDIVQGSKDWLNIRKGLFTSSNIEKLFKDPQSKKAKELGMLSDSAKTYIEEKATELIYYDCNLPSEETYAKALQWGNTYEPYAVEAYEHTTKQTTKEIGFVTLGTNTGTSPDRYVGDDGLLEIKCPYINSNHIKNIARLEEQKDLLKLNKQYYLQIQHQLYVTGRKWCDFVSFDPRLLESSDNWHKCIYVIRITPDTNLDFKGRIERAAEYRDYVIKRVIG